MMSCLIFFRQGFVARYAINHRSDFALAEAIKGESGNGNIGSTNPRRLELRSIGDNQQDPERFEPIHSPTQHFEARWVYPMQILENHQYRLGMRQRLQLNRKRFERLLSPAEVRKKQVERRLTRGPLQSIYSTHQG